MKTKAPFRLLYNNDTTNTTGVVSPWHQQGEPFREDMLVASNWTFCVTASSSVTV